MTVKRTFCTLDLPAAVYQQLDAEAQRRGKSPQDVVTEWLTERLAPPPPALDSSREELRRVLREAGLLAELDPELRKLADPTISLEEVQAILSRSGGKSLSAIVLEQRRAKDW